MRSQNEVTLNLRSSVKFNILNLKIVVKINLRYTAPRVSDLYYLTFCCFQMECELTFLGLVILENKLKPATAAVIKELKDADIHVVMITGTLAFTVV